MSTEYELDQKYPLGEVEALDVEKHASLAAFLANCSTEPRMMKKWLNGKEAQLIDESGLSHKHKEILRRGNVREIDAAVKEETDGEDMYCFVFVRNSVDGSL